MTPQPDPRVRLAVVVSLAVTLVACVVGAIVLSTGSNEIPEFLSVVGGAAVGGLVGVLTPGP